MTSLPNDQVVTCARSNRNAARHQIGIYARHRRNPHAEEGRPPESIFDFVQGITAVARDKPHQDARLDMEAKAKKLLDRVH